MTPSTRLGGFKILKNVLWVSLVYSQKKNHCRSFTLEEDLPRLAEVLSDYPDIRLVVIDPIKPFNARVDRGIPSGTISSTTRGGS